MEVKNPGLKDAMRSYLDETLPIMAEAVNSPGVAKSIESLDPASCRPSPRESEQWILTRIHINLRAKLQQVPAWKCCVQAIQADEVISSHLGHLVGTHTGRRRINLEMVVDWVVGKILIDMDTFRTGESRFDVRYAEFEEFFYGDTVDMHVVTPVSGLCTAISPVALGDGLEIRSLNDNESQTLSEALQFGSHVWALPSAGVTARFAVPKFVTPPEPLENKVEASRTLEAAARGRVEAVTHALAVFQAGELVPLGTISYCSQTFGGLTFQYPPSIVNSHGKQYSMSVDETRTFQDFWQRFAGAGVKNWKGLLTGIRRFVYAKQRTRADDRLLDLMIAAEALFLSEVGSEKYRGELSLRLALHAALLLGDDAADPREVFALFRKAYDLRSAVVHGGAPKLPRVSDACATRVTMDKFADDIEHAMRRALRKAVDSAAGGSSQRTCFDWNAMLFNRLAPSETRASADGP